MLEDKILDMAIDAIYEEAGLEIVVLEREYALYGKKRIDAMLHLPGRNIQLLAEVKKWVNHMNVGAVINQVNQLGTHEEVIFVADYINPNMGEKLKEANVQYMDTVGNAYINRMPLYVYVKGNKEGNKLQRKQGATTGRAFQQTGLRVIYEFLRDKELINAPYRQIAKTAKVALGNIGWILGDLVNQGYIIEGVEKNNRKIANDGELLTKWVEEYPHKLKNKLRLGVFTTEKPDWREAIDLEAVGALWGGEIAGAEYTKYLNPRDAVVYIDIEKVAQFLKRGRMRKLNPHEKDGVRIDIIERFWKADDLEEKTRLVNPIIAYADLIETGNQRNLETAKRLREQFIN